jgi:hypothetical protein
MAVKPIETAPKHLKGCDSPRSEVLTGALIEVDEIWCVLCELWLEKQEELNSYYKRVYSYHKHRRLLVSINSIFMFRLELLILRPEFCEKK